jgi:toxin ParE1/3/4
MKSCTVKFAARATSQLTELYTYIADHSDEIRAGRFVDDIISCCRALETFPERGTKRDDIYPQLRTFGYARRVTIAFTVDPTSMTVIIQGVFYGGQDFEQLLRDSDE